MRGYWKGALSIILWKLLKAAIGVAVIFGALYSFVWITGTFLNLDPSAVPLLAPHQVRNLAIFLSGAFCLLVLVGKI